MTLSEASSAYHTRGTIMRRRFTQTEVYYLNTLPAVERASMDRITYSKEFQVRCMAQYLRGNGPTSIFASAGLDPKIMGGKRSNARSPVGKPIRKSCLKHRRWQTNPIPGSAICW